MPDPSHVIYFQAICGGLFSIQLVEVRGDCFFGSYCWNFFVILADLKKKTFHIGKDNDGDPEMPYNDYVCHELAFISYQLVLEININ